MIPLNGWWNTVSVCCVGAGVGGKHPDHTALGSRALREHPRPLQGSFWKEKEPALGYPCLLDSWLCRDLALWLWTSCSAFLKLNVHVCQTKIWNRCVQIHISVNVGSRLHALQLDRITQRLVSPELGASQLYGFLLHCTHHLLGPVQMPSYMEAFLKPPKAAW